MELNTFKDKTYQFKCPTCQKAYQVKDTEIFSSEPEFECMFCREKFSMKISSESGGLVQVRKMEIAKIKSFHLSDRKFANEFVSDVAKARQLLTENANRLKPSRVFVGLKLFGKYGPVFLGLLLIAVGFSSISMRNLVGIGVALLVFVTGFRMIRSGEFRFKDHF